VIKINKYVFHHTKVVFKTLNIYIAARKHFKINSPHITAIVKPIRS